MVPYVVSYNAVEFCILSRLADNQCNESCQVQFELWSLTVHTKLYTPSTINSWDRVARCREMATLPAGYIPQHKVSSVSSSGSLGFIVCVQCCRMVDSVPIRHTISIL